MPRAGTKQPSQLRVLIDAKLRAQGYNSMSQACRAVGLDYVTFGKLLKGGLTKNPRVNTVEALRRLDLLTLFQRPA